MHFTLRSLSLLVALSAASLLAQEPSAEYRLGSGQASPGETVALPFFVKTTVFGMEGFSYSLDFDEEVVEVLAIDRVYQNPDGEDWFFHVNFFDNSNDTPGNGGIDEGYLAGGNVLVIGQLPPELLPPVDVDNEMLRVTFRVKPDASPGETELRFLEGGKTHPDSPGVINIVTVDQRSEVPDDKVAAVTIGAVLKIVPEPDVTLFLRGDSNYDQNIDQTDAIVTLRFLFLGDTPPTCMDAADSNDDGILDISDGVTTLTYLFLDSKVMAQPIRAPGLDPTPDDVFGCEGNGRS